MMNSTCVKCNQERSQAVGAEIEGVHKAQHVKDDCGVMQTMTTSVPSGQSESNQNLTHSDDVPEDALGRCKLECLQNILGCESGKALLRNGSRGMPLGNASTSYGPDLVQDEGSKNLELDKSLPPIKTRREGQAREHSPSDLSPPSPKRLRQGCQETQDQWNDLWSVEGKP